ncbi:hypothetical protein SAMN04489713_104252 [Actinomadura madurae]|uniref:Uncharacterized protein n=1 Tax=Actinomadura madurae TaxID=1993 RepID=A0A1I5ES14_9ACTN|nr:hypothetical protein SAMN04489713_104252 [Actinomadura madurae]
MKRMKALKREAIDLHDAVMAGRISLDAAALARMKRSDMARP